MRVLSTKKRKVAAVLGAGAIAVASAGTAIAFWTSTGSGSGTATVGAGTNDLTINSDAVSGLVPGGSVPLSVHVHNTNATTDEAFSTISYTITTNAPTTVDDGTGCNPADFTITGLPASGTVAHGATNDYSATIAMANSANNQNGCKSASLSIAYTS